MLDLEAAQDDPYVSDGGLLATDQHPTEGTYRSIAFPVPLSRTPGGMRTPTPAVGQDTAAVLRELRRDDAEVAALAASGAAVIADPAVPTAREQSS